MTQAEAIRKALRDLPNLAATSVATRPDIEDVYFPSSHLGALDPDVSLVIGNRGMGKTFWTLALADPTVRSRIGEKFFSRRRQAFAAMNVQVGFGDAEGAVGVVGRQVLESVPPNEPVENIWRAVLLRVLAPLVGHELPPQFRALVEWVRENPEEQLAIFRSVDSKLSADDGSILILFDQLDQLANDWSRTRELTTGLIRVALAMKSYRAIKIKLFMRPDQGDDKVLFRFPDASKILNERQTLTWRAHDLYGLLFFELYKTEQATLDAWCEERGYGIDFTYTRVGIPWVLAAGDPQANMFHAVAGEFMGRSAKRGRPYTWLPVHLADGRGEISPRTFLQVMKVAAQRADGETATAIDFKGILDGVRTASRTRLAELEEDYPWVSVALEPLRGLLVPCEAFEIADRWEAANTTNRIANQFSGTRAPIELEIAALVGTEDAHRILIRLLLEIGVFESRKNGKVNVPDIFRVDAGILRKGGVPPQDRGKL